MNKICKICGCSDRDPCYHPEHGNCSWADIDICSHCVMLQEGIISEDETTSCRANKNKRKIHLEFEICIDVKCDSQGRMIISTSTNPEGICTEEVDKALKLLYTNVNLKKKNDPNLLKR